MMRAVCKRFAAVLQNYIRLPSPSCEENADPFLTNVITELLLKIISHEIKKKSVGKQKLMWGVFRTQFPPDREHFLLEHKAKNLIAVWENNRSLLRENCMKRVTLVVQNAEMLRLSLKQLYFVITALWTVRSSVPVSQKTHDFSVGRLRSGAV